MACNPQESLENTINTMGPTLLGVHPSLSLDNMEVIMLENYELLFGHLLLLMAEILHHLGCMKPYK